MSKKKSYLDRGEVCGMIRTWSSGYAQHCTVKTILFCKPLQENKKNEWIKITQSKRNVYDIFLLTEESSWRKIYLLHKSTIFYINRTFYKDTFCYWSWFYYQKWHECTSLFPLLILRTWGVKDSICNLNNFSSIDIYGLNLNITNQSNDT